MSTIAWGYFAVSTDRQSDSLPEQEHWARSVALERGWEITEVFSEPGSGKAGPRKLMRRMLAALRSAADKPSVILMNRLDRFGRGKMVDSQVVLAEITDMGVQVFTRESGFVKNETWQDEMINAIRFAVARQENEAKADRARAGHERKRREGRHSGHPPYGVKLDEQGKSAADEPRASIVREMYEMRATGAGYEAIAHAIAPKAPPKPTKEGARKLSWHRTLIRTMLKCRTYRETVVPVDLWDAVQGVKNPDFKTGPQKYPWPLAGVLRCSCGYSYTGKCTGGNCQRCKNGKRKHAHAKIRYYVCNAPANHIGTNDRRNVRADRVEAQFLELVQRLQAEPELVEAFRNRRGGVDVATLRERLRGLESDLQRVDARRTAAFDLQADGDIDKDELRRRLAEVQEQRTEIARHIDAVKREIAVASAEESVRRDATRILARVTDAWGKASWPDQKRMASLIASIVGGLTLDDAGNLRAGCDELSVKEWEQTCPNGSSRLLDALQAILA